MIKDINRLQHIKSIQKMNLEIRLQQLNSQCLMIREQINNTEEKYAELVKHKDEYINNFYLGLKISQFGTEEFYKFEHSLRVYEGKIKDIQENINQLYNSLQEAKQKAAVLNGDIKKLTIQQEKYNFILDAIK